MILNIPTIGEVEINKVLPRKLIDNERSQLFDTNFYTTKANGKTVLIGDRLNSSAFVMELLDYENEDLIVLLEDFYLYDCDFWYEYSRNKKYSNGETAPFISTIFNFLIDKNIIIKVYNKNLKESGISTEDYVYVLPSYEDFNIMREEDLYLEYANVCYKVLNDIRDNFLKHTKNGYVINSVRKNYKETLHYMGEVIRDYYYCDFS